MRIDQMTQLEKRCTGCMACVDVCPKRCISKNISQQGFFYTTIEENACIDCGKCGSVCPIQNKQANDTEQHLFAAYAKESSCRDGGSSGGAFECIARHFLKQGYAICGAAFDSKLQLKHRIVCHENDISPLLKSKYLQSDMSGIYAEILKKLKAGEKVFFCGTPCQVSALINSVPAAYRDHLRTADIICHGVPSQAMFDAYIRTIEQRQKAKIVGFTFRVKNNRYKHAHGFSYDLERNGSAKTIQGIYTQSTFYYAFKKYLIFRESCYDCQYTTKERVSDITLADFWGIEKYDFKGTTDKGVSMLITNTENGEEIVNAISDAMIIKEFPLQYGINSNHCFTHSTKKPAKRDAILDLFEKEGWNAVEKQYLKGGNSIKNRLYWLLPASARNMLRKIRGRMH